MSAGPIAGERWEEEEVVVVEQEEQEQGSKEC